MSQKTGWIVAGVLFVVFVVLSFTLAQRSGEATRVPVFLPLMSDTGGEAPPPGPPPESPSATPTGPPPPSPAPTSSGPNTELAGVETMEILQQTGRLAATVSIEDFIRGLILLEQEGGKLALTPEQKAKLLPIVKRAFERRRDLLTTHQKIRELESELPEVAAAAARNLTPDQRRLIRERRDVTSIQGVEDPYWENLIARLETSR
ncbi:MAG: hypothetical protein H6685_13270 [Deltaproteobacteria bacterium]|nr:hypothetical protein [Deltaproteobacteria bacterium]